MFGDATRDEQKDAKRIAARREREALRVKRFLHDPFNRQIGIDHEALQKQIEEKRNTARLHANQEQEEREQMRHIAKMLDTIELEKREQERNKKDSIRAEWAEAIAIKQSREEREKRIESNATIRSGIQWQGADLMRGERKRMQQMQMQSWILQQRADKQTVADKDSKEDKKYLSVLKALEERAKEAEREKQARKRQLAIEVRMQNEAAAQMRRELTSRERKRALQTAGSAVAIEDTFIPSNDFRQFSDEQKESIRNENAALLTQAAERRQQEQREKEEYARQIQAQANYAEAAHIQAQDKEQQTRRQHAAYLKLQQQEAEQRREQQRKNEQRGGFSDGFFAGFGRSSR